ncbi:MAG: HypC/HybG/HupF family hydrogenase formation chaperone [Actinomycetes bacterium]
MCLAVPAQIVEIVDTEYRLAKAETGGVSRTVNVMCVASTDEEVADLVGKWVLIHVGFAMNIIDEDDAAATLALLTDLLQFNPDEERV